MFECNLGEPLPPIGLVLSGTIFHAVADLLELLPPVELFIAVHPIAPVSKFSLIKTAVVIGTVVVDVKSKGAPGQTIDLEAAAVSCGPATTCIVNITNRSQPFKFNL